MFLHMSVYIVFVHLCILSYCDLTRVTLYRVDYIDDVYHGGRLVAFTRKPAVWILIMTC